MIRFRRPWEISEKEVTPQAVYENRREFLKTMGHVGLGAAAIMMFPRVPGLSHAWAATGESGAAAKVSFPPEADITPSSIGSRFNNFYEFGTAKDKLWEMAQKLETDGWGIEVAGLVKKPRVLDAAALIKKMPSEERIYRLRCVEAWAVVLPWTGFELRELIRLLQPLSSARYVKFTTFLDPNIAAGQKKRFWEPWPYTEGLSLDEAMHELSFMATGIYGSPLPAQHGAPIRLVVPWKYGFKSIKSIVRIEFTRDEPETFWQNMSPLEYDFAANVIPKVPYARWHQEFERVPGKEGTVKTKLYNGYAAQVARLYSS